MAAFLERVFPFLLRGHTKRGFLNLARLATYFGQEDGLDSERLELWRKISFLAAYTLVELFVKNSHRGVDWKLKKQCKRIGMDNMVTLFAWMQDYFLSLLRRTGVKGKLVENDFLALKGTAERFPSFCAAQLKGFTRVAVPLSGPFSQTWESDSPDKVASDLCLAIHKLLGLEPSPVVRIVGVVQFMEATLDAYLVSIGELGEFARRLASQQKR